jgi:hypothetical protein
VSAEALDELGDLESELLYVFVAGPGLGEAIAVRLPSAGWILVDGCLTPLKGGSRTPTKAPLLAILDRWQADDERVLLACLTHPHEDHAHGMPEVLDRARPDRVAVSASTPRALLEQAQRCDAIAAEALATSDRLRASAVVSAYQAMVRHLERGARWIPLRDGRPVVRTAGGSVTPRAPTKHAVREAEREARQSPKANEVSAVLEIRWEKAFVVLGGDLECRGLDGWDQVMQRHPKLARHAGLKVPHHGSSGALHPSLIAPARRERAWFVTPFNRQGLPRCGPGEGLAQLCTAEASILLTALPVGVRAQPPLPANGVVDLARMQALVEPLRTGNSFVDGATAIGPGRASAPLDPCWCVAIDAEGRVAGRWRGSIALEVQGSSS